MVNRLKFKQIKWTYIASFNFSGWYGTLSGYKFFKIECENGCYSIYSKFTSKQFFNDLKYINVCFDNLENAKKYCQNELLKEIVEIFVELEED